MPGILAIARKGLVIEVSSPYAVDLKWLSECLTPGFSVVAPGHPQWQISRHIDDQAYRRLEKQGPNTSRPPVPFFSFDEQASEYSVWNDEHLTIQDPEYQLFYRLWPEEKRVEVVAAVPRTSTRVALLRLVREISTQHLVRHDQIQFHAAALSLAGHGLMICGPKRAGKTSLTIHALSHPEASFISNDRAIVEVDPRSQLLVSGMPTVIAIRPGTISLFPGLKLSQIRHWRARMTLDEARQATEPDEGQPTPEKLNLNPHQFCDVLGTTAVDLAPLRTVIFPRVDTTREGIELRSLDQRAVLLALKQNLLPLVPSLLAVSMESVANPQRAEVILHELAAQIQGYECILGEGAFVDDTLVPRVLGWIGL